MRVELVSAAAGGASAPPVSALGPSPPAPACPTRAIRRVAIQEAERWNVLLSEMRRSLAELDLGLKGDLTMTEPMVGSGIGVGPAVWASSRPEHGTAVLQQSTPLPVPSPPTPAGAADARAGGGPRARQLGGGGLSQPAPAGLLDAQPAAARRPDPGVVLRPLGAQERVAQRVRGGGCGNAGALCVVLCRAAA